MTQTETLEIKKTSIIKDKQLIVYNDDVNTFDFVIECLVDICGHEVVQAEQCTWLIHYKGKCAVKKGDDKTLLIMKNQLLDFGLTAEVQ